jgi:hypothetical protein
MHSVAPSLPDLETMTSGHLPSSEYALCASARSPAGRALVLLLALLSGIASTSAQAGTQTRTASAATCASLGGGGANWTNPANGGVSDDLYAQATVDGTVTDALACDDYGFSIPASAVVLGIVVNVERKSTSVANGGSRDQSLRLLKAGVAVGSNLATATVYTTTDTVEAHGGPADLWGTTWTPAEINAGNFGAVFTATKPSGTGGSHTLTIDQIEIIVYYTDSSQTKAGACTSLGGGGANWTTPDNATVTDNAYAQATVDGSTTDPLRCIGYGFAIPDGATILGIRVDVERKSNRITNGGSRDSSLQLAKGGAAVGLDRATATTYTTVDVVEAHGGTADLWGTTWTPAEINAADFGAIFSATKPSGAGASHTLTIDMIRITVTYAQPPPSLITPADGAILTNGTPTFDWSDVVDFDGAVAITYDLQVDSTPAGAADCTFASPEVNQAGLVASQFTPGAALADGSYCWRARAVDTEIGTWSATRTVTINTVGAFDAVEVGAATGTTVHTKLVGTSFNLDVIALKSGSLFAGYRGTVAVELVDGASSGTCSLMSALAAIGNLAFDNTHGGRRATSFSYASASRNVRVRITDASVAPPVVSCSTDNFAIRPTGFSSVTSNMTNAGTSGAPVIAAGQSFTLTAVAGAGYDGTPSINGANVAAHAGAPQVGTIGGSFGVADALGGTATGSAFTYSEVGNFTLGVNAVYDATFTAVDSANGGCTSDFSNALVGGRYGCSFGNGTSSDPVGRFRPDHFAVIAAGTLAPGCAAGTPFTYFGQPFAVSGIQLHARNTSNVRTHNYTGSFVQHDPAAVAGWNLAARDIGSATTVALDTAATIIAGSWLDGALSATFSNVAAVRAATVASPLSDVRIGIATSDAEGVAIPASAYDVDLVNPAGADRKQIGSAALLRYGRLRMQNALASSTAVSLPLPMEVQYWNGTAFVRNQDDSCTTLPQAEIGLSDYRVNLAVTETAIVQNPVTFTAGQGNATLSPPGAGNNGSVLVTPNLPGAGRSYLQGAWTGATFTENPNARATFGVFGSQPRNFIYQRENFQ